MQFYWLPSWEQCQSITPFHPPGYGSAYLCSYCWLAHHILPKSFTGVEWDRVSPDVLINLLYYLFFLTNQIYSMMDGRLLQPTRPLLSLDSTFVQRAFDSGGPQVYVSVAYTEVNTISNLNFLA